MVPYHRPIPNAKSNLGPGGKANGAISTLVQAEKLMQIALVLPCAAFVGWFGGALLDRHFHQSWIALVGIVFGGASGLFYVIRLAIDTNKDPALRDADDGQSGKGNSDSNS